MTMIRRWVVGLGVAVATVISILILQPQTTTAQMSLALTLETAGLTLTELAEGVYGLIGKIICLLLTLCAFYWVTIGVTQIIYQRAIYLMLTAVLCFLYFPFGKNSPRDRFSIPDVILSLLMIADTIYVAYGFVERVERLGFPNTMVRLISEL